MERYKSKFVRWPEQKHKRNQYPVQVEHMFSSNIKKRVTTVMQYKDNVLLFK